MTKVKIFKKDGTPTQYFWSEEDGADRTHKTVYKETEGGEIKRMRGVHYDAVAKRIHKE